jgi:NADPH2:quinone reductase
MVHHHVRTREALLTRSNQLFDWVREGRLKVHVGGRYPLAEAAQAHRDIQSRRTTGKLLLIP